MSVERLALGLWGEDAPAGAVKTVQVHVSRLRKALGDDDAVDHDARGLRAARAPGRARRRALRASWSRTAARALAAGHPEQRRAHAARRAGPLARAAAGRPRLEPFAQAEVARLDEQRLAALEARIDADLAAGRHAEVVGELRALVAAHPARERLAAQLMLALYRCGRQTEALEAYARVRTRAEPTSWAWSRAPRCRSCRRRSSTRAGAGPARRAGPPSR